MEEFEYNRWNPKPLVPTISFQVFFHTAFLTSQCNAPKATQFLSFLLLKITNITYNLALATHLSKALSQSAKFSPFHGGQLCKSQLWGVSPDE